VLKDTFELISYSVHFTVKLSIFNLFLHESRAYAAAIALGHGSHSGPRSATPRWPDGGGDGGLLRHVRLLVAPNQSELPKTHPQKPILALIASSMQPIFLLARGSRTTSGENRLGSLFDLPSTPRPGSGIIGAVP